MFIPNYDYKVEEANCYVDAAYLESAIVDNAGDGWELVTVIQPNAEGDRFFLVFKRPIA